MKFAVVSAWPEVKNAEYEIIERIKISAKNLQAECIVVDNEGYVIGRDDKRTGEYLEGHEVEFVIALHFITEKLYNAYTYGAMWNPPKFLVDWGYEAESNKYYTYDDYLIYGSRKIDGHLENLLVQTDKDISECLHFMTTVPGTPIPPKLTDDIKLFYSGINWERMSNSKGRHHDLFKALDDEGLTRIYGPEKFFDAVPWAGFKTYAGSLPFDGLSAIQAISECGASLVLTSNIHREAEAVSSRLFESCAAGVVLICDDNPYIVREFGDSVLYVTYDETDFRKNIDQIKQHLAWIKDNKAEAIELSKRSQAIYVEKFHLDNVLGNIITSHPARKAQVIAQTCDIDTGVSVIVRILESDANLLPLIQSLNTQYNALYIDLIVICNQEDNARISEIFSKNISPLIEWKVIGLPLFDRDGKRVITTGEMLVKGIENSKYGYIAAIDQGRVLFDDHLSLGLKQFQNPAVSMSYTGICIHDLQADKSIKRYKHFFGNYHIADIVSFSEHVDLSSLMFKKSSLEKYYHHLAMLDGREVSSIMMASFLAGEWKFSYKTTLVVNLSHSIDTQNAFKRMLDDSWQIKLVQDAFKYNQKIANATQQNVRHIDISLIEMSQFESLLKRFLKSKIEAKYPKFLLIIKKIYNKVFK